MDQALFIGEAHPCDLPVQEDFLSEAYASSGVAPCGVDLSEKPLDGTDRTSARHGRRGIEGVAGDDSPQVLVQGAGLVEEIQADHLFADGADDTDLVRERLDPVEVVRDAFLHLLLDVVESVGLRVDVVGYRLTLNFVPYAALVRSPTGDVARPCLQIRDLGSPERPGCVLAGGGNGSPRSPATCFDTGDRHN